MKTRIKSSISYFLLAVALSAMLIAGCSCSLFYPEPPHDPLASFHWSSLNNLDSNKAITDDCNNYLKKLSPEERNSPSLHFYEDGTGQHAINITIGVNGRWWRHILIYDKDNKRIKTIKYPTGYYAS